MAGGQQGCLQILLLSSNNQRLKPAAHISHRQQTLQGLGKPLPTCLPHSITTRFTAAVHSLNRGFWEYYLFLSSAAVFTQGNQQSNKNIYTLRTEEEEYYIHVCYMPTSTGLTELKFPIYENGLKGPKKNNEIK